MAGLPLERIASAMPRALMLRGADSASGKGATASQAASGVCAWAGGSLPSTLGPAALHHLLEQRVGLRAHHQVGIVEYQRRHTG